MAQALGPHSHEADRGDAASIKKLLSHHVAESNSFTLLPQVQPASGLVSNISAASGKTYALAELAVGAKHYTDRTYQITSVPSSLAGITLVQAANDDKFSTASNALSFQLSQTATLYVAYDPRVTALPDWLSDWQKLTDRIGINDPKISYMVLYSKTFPAGTLTLGGNMQSPAAGAQNNYFVLARADQNQQTSYTLSVNTTGNGTVLKSPNQTNYFAGSTVTLTATPEAGYEFSGWSGDASGMTNPLAVSMSANKVVTANFSASIRQELLLFTPTSSTVNLPSGQHRELKVNLNNSDEDPVIVQLTATEGSSTNAPGWLLYEGKLLTEANNVTYDLGASGNEVHFTVDAGALSAGTYTATVRATASGYTSATLYITLKVDSYEESMRPYVTAVRPADGAISVSLSQSVSVDVRYPSGQSIDGNTVNPSTVKLYKVTGTTKTEVAGTVVNATAAGDAITLSASLDVNTTYEFFISDQVKDGNGYRMKPFTSRFKTISSTSDIPTQLEGIAFREQILVDRTFGSDGFTTLVIGPDHRLYATTSGGKIERWDIQADGTLTNHTTISPFNATRRLLIGLRFDPSATASNMIAWISHSAPEFTDAPDWAGKISRVDLTNPTAPQVTDYVTNLPRSIKDHATNGIDFGPDGALYFVQGGNTAMGAPDGAWGQRPERKLSAAVLRLDVLKAQQLTLPIDAKTEEGGSYNPYATNAPLTIYATGVRNAYDLVWHSNGQLYVPTNGSAAGGNTPELKSGSVWSNGQTYTGPDVPAMSDIRLSQSDYLFRVERGGYYGHPNIARNEYIMNGANPTAGIDPGEITWTENGQAYGYPVGTPIEPNYKGWSFDFGLNKSPNGVIEYKSSAFDGKLKGKLLVCRFSGGDDIMVLEPGTSNLDIIRATEGSSVPGFRRPFANPLDVIEDVSNGNLYISEYFDGNGDGQPRITLLRAEQAEKEPQVAVKLINAGGTQYIDSQSRTWAADTHFSGGITSSKTFDVAGTTDDPLYLHYRYASSRAPFTYSVPVSEAGTYTVKLHFVEPYYGAPGGRAAVGGERIFHVDIEGQRLLNNYDIFKDGGAAKAMILTFNDISVTDGTLDLLFTSVKDNAIISAIEVTTAAKVTNYTLEVNTTGSGSVTRTPNQESYAAGSGVTLTANPAAGYRFTGWSGNSTGEESPLNLTMDGDKTVTANFTAIAYTVSATAGTGGAVAISPEKASYNYGEKLSITATPAAGYVFTGWSGDAMGTDNPLSLTVTNNTSVQASFAPVAPAQYNLAVTTSGSGEVSPGSGTYTAGESVTLTATPAAGYVFAGWSGDATGLDNPLKLTMDGNKGVTATFTQIQPTTYTLSVNFEGNGTVTRSPEGNSYEAGTSVALTATPAAGYRFTGWSGAATGTENPVTVTMDDDKSVTAKFEAMTSLSTMLVNAGGPQYSDVDGKKWSADVHFSGGTTSSKTFDVAGTTDDELYRKYRYASSRAPFSYSLPVSEADTYTVKLHFLEPYFGAPGGGAGKVGARVFHVDLEGQRVLSNYDIFAQDGAGKAIIKVFEGVNITDGALDLLFSSVKDNAIISAIEITKAAAPANYALNVNTTGSGTVTRSPAQDSYATGTNVSLTATPNAGNVFAGWSGDATGITNPLTLTMNSDKSVTATFTQVQQATYTLTVNYEGNGTVTRSPDLDTYEAGTSVALTATPAAGYRFTGWSGAATGTENPVTVIMDGDKSVTAKFEAMTSLSTMLVNAGGPQYSDVDGKTWSADVYFSGGTTSSKTFDVAGTTDDELYRKYRYASSRAPFSYSLPVSEAGTYTVKLHFLEPYFGAPGGGAGKVGARVFHVDLEGQRVLSNYDIFAQDGAGKAIIKVFEGVNVTDGALDLLFSSVKDNAIISAIEITKAAAPANYALNVNTTGSGTVTRSPEQDSYAAGVSVTLTATPDIGYVFAGWSGDATGSANPLTLTMDGNKGVTATFTQVQKTSFTLTVGMEGSGTVTRSPDLDSYEAGTSVTLTATPATGYRFTGWSSDVSGKTNPLVITMDSDKMVTAHFEAEPYFITIDPAVGGSTSKSPSKVAYVYGDVVSLTAVPEPGYEFVEWTGDLTGTSNPLETTVTGSITIKANFRVKQYVLTTNAGPGGSVAADPVQTSYAYGTVVTLTATPDADAQFTGWSGNASGTQNPITITMDADKSVTANFTAKLATSSTVRINAGGTTKEITGMVWMGCPDATDCNNYLTGGNSYNKSSTAITGIPQHMDQEMFETGWENTIDINQEINSTAFTYSIPVISGDYLVRLYFVELDNIAAGQRVFNVNLEGGTNEISGLDIAKEVGLNTVLMREIPVTITDGNINLDFNRQVNTPTLSAIEIIPASSATPIVLGPDGSQETMSVMAYPNPNPGDQVYVDVLHFGANEAVNLSIYNISGRVVLEAATVTNAAGKASTELKLNQRLSKGVYIIRAVSASGSSHAKLLIQ